MMQKDCLPIPPVAQRPQQEHHSTSSPPDYIPPEREYAASEARDKHNHRSTEIPPV